MNISLRVFQLLLASCLAATSSAPAQTPQEPLQPIWGQAGKDVVWIPTPGDLVGKMLDLARVTPQDYVIDLGSGDGRNVIAAARRGARALGVEYNSEMIELSRRAAAMEGVADRARFVQGDMFEADISQATVLTLFLRSENLRKLTPKFLELRPGTRIVANTFGIDGWEPDQTYQAEGDCGAWCSVFLYIVPARAAGTWRLAQGELTLEQNFQLLSGTLSSGGTRAPIANGRLRGDRIGFSVGGVEYAGRVNGYTMAGDVKGGASRTWSAIRTRSLTPAAKP